MRAFAVAVAKDELDLDGSVPLDRLETQLCELPGIGPWTAQYLALRLGYADAYPTSDLGLLNALGGVTPMESAAAAEAWRPWRAYAAVRLWTHGGERLRRRDPAPQRADRSS